jgi:hypothetical protein
VAAALLRFFGALGQPQHRPRAILCFARASGSVNLVQYMQRLQSGHAISGRLDVEMMVFSIATRTSGTTSNGNGMIMRSIWLPGAF